MQSKLLHLDERVFKDILKNKETIAVRFWAPWCAPCRMMSQSYHKVANNLSTDSIGIGEVNIDEHPQLAARLNIRSIPTIVVFKKGKETSRSTGLLKEKQIENLILNPYK